MFIVLICSFLLFSRAFFLCSNVRKIVYANRIGNSINGSLSYLACEYLWVHNEAIK